MLTSKLSVIKNAYFNKKHEQFFSSIIDSAIATEAHLLLGCKERKQGEQTAIFCSGINEEKIK